MANSSHDQPLSLLGPWLQLLPSIAEEPKQASATGHRGCHSDLGLLGCTVILASIVLGMELAELAGDGLRLPPPPGPPSSITLLPLSDCNSTKLLLPSDMEDAPLDEQPSPTESPACLPQWSPLVGMVVESFKKDPYQPLAPTHMSATQALSQAYRWTPSEGASQQGPGHTGCQEALPFPASLDPHLLTLSEPPARTRSSPVQVPLQCSLRRHWPLHPSLDRPHLDPWKFISLG